MNDKFEEELEAAYWKFDTINKKGSRSERDAFKLAVRELFAKIQNTMVNFNNNETKIKNRLDPADEKILYDNLWDLYES